MKAIKWIVISLMILITIIIIWGASLPSQWQVSQTKNIDAAPGKILSFVGSPPTWPLWSAWNQTNYPEMQITHAGPKFGPGSIQRWDDSSSNGEVEIKKVSADEVNYRVTMDNGAFGMDCKFVLKSNQPAQTQVDWLCNGESDGIMEKMMMQIFSPMMAKEFAEGLTGLKRLVETGQ